MGYMTNVTILNDTFDWVQRNPEKFVSAIQSGMNSGTDPDLWYSREDYRTDDERQAAAHYVTVHKAEHADIPQIIYSRANSTYPIHQFAYGRLRQWVIRNGLKSDNAQTRIRIARGVINDLRHHAGMMEAELDAIEKERA